MIYRIHKWDASFETCETRKLEVLRWVPVPNKHDGLSFRRMVREPDRCELFAAWNLMLQIASRGRKQERGLLARGGVPLEPEDMADMTGFPPEVFERAISFFSSERIGWLEVVPTATVSDTPQNGPDSTLNPSSPAQTGEPPAPAGTSPVEWKEGRKECTQREKGDSPAVEAVRPSSFPESEQAAVSVGSFIGVPPEICVTAYHKAVSRGYADAKGIKIVNFSSHLKTEQVYDTNRKASEQHRPPANSSRPTRPNRNQGTFNDNPAVRDQYAQAGERL